MEESNLVLQLVLFGENIRENIKKPSELLYIEDKKHYSETIYFENKVIIYGQFIPTVKEKITPSPHNPAGNRNNHDTE